MLTAIYFVTRILISLFFISVFFILFKIPSLIDLLCNTRITFLLALHFVFKIQLHLSYNTNYEDMPFVKSQVYNVYRTFAKSCIA